MQREMKVLREGSINDNERETELTITIIHEKMHEDGMSDAGNAAQAIEDELWLDSEGVGCSIDWTNQTEIMYGS